MELSNKVNYLKGLMDGLNIDDSTPEGKVLNVIADILEDMALTVEDVADEADATVDAIEDIAEEISDLEDYVGCCGDDFDDECCDNDCCCDDDFDDDEEMYECVCPTCGESIMLGESIIETGEVDCPNCGEHLEFDFSDLSDDEEE